MEGIITVLQEEKMLLLSGIEISDEDGKQGSSGFDVGVDGWGEFEDVVIPLK